MPHAWWHQWGQPQDLVSQKEMQRQELERIAQQRINEAEQNRIARESQQTSQNPSIWNQFTQSDPVQFLLEGRGPESRVFPGLKNEFTSFLESPVVQIPMQGMETISEKALKPAVGEVFRQPIVSAITPTWKDDKDDPQPWYKQFEWHTDDIPKTPSDIFKSAQRMMPIAGGIPAGVIAAPFEEFLDKEIIERPNTIREQRITQETARRERETGVPVTQRERREISQDMYKLPPGVLGTAEELPWFFVPPAKAARSGIQALRTGQAMTQTGRLGKAAPVARGALKAAEEVLSPVQAVEEGFNKALQLTGKGLYQPVRWGITPINRALAEKRTRVIADQVNEMLNTETRIDPATGKQTGPYTPQEGLDALNQMVSNRLGIDDPLYEIVNGQIVRNSTPMPRNVNMMYQPNAESEKVFNELFPKLTDNEITARSREPRPPSEQRYNTQTGERLPTVPEEQVIPTTAAVPETPPATVTTTRLVEGYVDGRVVPRTPEGNPPEVLYRLMDRQQYDNAVNRGVLEPTPGGDGRIYAAGEPKLQYIENPNRPSVVVAIDYSDTDGWVARIAGDDISAATSNPIPVSKVSIVAEGANKRELIDRFNALQRGFEPSPTAAETIMDRPRSRELTYGEGDSWVPNPQESSPAATEARRQATDIGQTHEAIEDVARSGVVSKNIENVLDAEQVSLETKNLSPGAADFYVKLMFSVHDSSFALRVLQDNYFRSINPEATFRPGSHRDVVAGIILSGGAPLRGMTFYQNFIRNTIEPLLGRTDAEKAAGTTSEVQIYHIERYLQSKHWLDIENTIGRKNMPKVFDPRPKLDADGNPTKELIGEVSSDNYKSWIDDIEKELTAEQFARVVKGAEETRSVYAHMREELFNEGIISREQYDAMREAYPWYNPIAYVEYNDANQVAKSMSIVNTGIYGYSDNPDIMNALPPLGETMLRRMVSHQLRIHRNRVNKAFVEMGNQSKIGLKDVTEELTKPINFRKYIDKDGVQREAPVFADASKLYSDTDATGYISFYEDGVRKIYGQQRKVGAKLETGFVDKVWWDALNGRAGLGVRGGMEVEDIFALTNSFFKSTYTTFDPLFMIGNGLIDQLVVGLKYRILPTAVWWRLASSIYRNMPAIGIPENRLTKSFAYKVTKPIKGREGTQLLDMNAFLSGDIKGGFVLGGEDRFRELMQLTGGYQNAVYDQKVVSRQIEREIRNAGHVNTAELIEPSQKNKLRDSLADGARKYFPVPTVGEYVEQAPRLLVGEKTLKRLIGKTEYKRLMKLSREDWEEELYHNWKRDGKDTGKALLDSAEARQASINALESTINFFRGGDTIRRWNNYVMFLNAAFEGAKVPFRMLGVDLHPNIKPVDDAVAGGQIFEFGEWYGLNGKRRGMTGKYDEPLGAIMGKQIDPRIAAASTVAAAMGAYGGLQYGYNFQHEEYWDIPTYIRYNSLVIMQPSERDEDGNKIIDPVTGRPVPNYITVPHRVRELSLFFGTLTYIMENAFREEPTDWTLYAKSIWKSSSPINSAPIPEAVNLVAEEMTGWDFFRKEPIVNDDYSHLPPEEQYNQYTSEAARIIANRLGDSNWAPELTKSPQRLEHLYENLTGGIGKRVLDGTDNTILLLEDLRKNEERPMQAKARDYRKMSRTQRREFIASLTAEEKLQFDKEIRKPVLDLEGNLVSKILGAAFASTGVEQRFGPDRAGGLREISIRRAEEAVPEVTNEQSRAAGSKLRFVRQDIQNLQNDNDTKLNMWSRGTGRGISPTEWREERKTKWKIVEGAQLFAGYVFPDAVQSKDKDTKQQWYDAVYNAAGDMPDMRSTTDMLIAGYYNITSPEDDPARTWSDFFNERNEYVNSIQQKSNAEGKPEIFSDFVSSLEKDMTDTEKRYNEASKLLSDYWDIGSTIDHLLPNASQQWPQMAELWQNYLLADYGTQRVMRSENKVLQDLSERRTLIRKNMLMDEYRRTGMGTMDAALMYWYGDFHRPVTPDGKQVYNDFYAKRGAQYSTVP